MEQAQRFAPVELRERQAPARRNMIRGQIQLAKFDVVPEFITNSIGMKLQLIPAGDFLMGSPASEDGHDDDESQHRVRISKPYYIQTTEVTQEQWRSVTGVTGTEPWKGQDFVMEGVDCAASYVSHDDAVEFCRKLSARDGATYRLPTEAEWEYACRGGTQTMYSFDSDTAQLGRYAWFRDNVKGIGEKHARRVGQKRANGLGLYDMHGNVAEWCSDWYDGEYYRSSPVGNPQGPSKGVYRINRGGNWCFPADSCRSANRDGGIPSYRTRYLGLRVVRSAVK